MVCENKSSLRRPLALLLALHERRQENRRYSGCSKCILRIGKRRQKAFYPSCENMYTKQCKFSKGSGGLKRSKGTRRRRLIQVPELSRLSETPAGENNQRVRELESNKSASKSKSGMKRQRAVKLASCGCTDPGRVGGASKV